MGTYLVTGVARPSSLATAITAALLEAGDRVILTAPPSTRRLTESVVRRAGWEVPIIDLDVTRATDLASLPRALHSHGVEELSGLVHAIAYAPTRLLGTGLPGPAGPEHEDWQAWQEELAHAFLTSAASLPALIHACEGFLHHGAQVVALSFESERVTEGYGWMGPLKAALDACVRSLAVACGPRGIAVNAVSAGPLPTPAASVIPGFETMREDWARRAPLGWEGDAKAVARTVQALLEGAFPATTGQIVMADGGAHLR